MNKTLTINVSGIIFHIEEDAYENLYRYLAEIKASFAGNDDGAEILADIESRIAELLKERISPSKEVIVYSDVEEVKRIMGRAEEFRDDERQDVPHEGPAVKRRLFRNPDDKVIGGVCGGLAAYFDIDAVWVRLVMFLLIFLGGVSIWVYIILWIVMPIATTTADRLAMRGETANISGIFRSVKEEARDVRNRMRSREYGETFKSNLAGALSAIFNIAGRLAGLFLLFVGGLMLMVFVATLVGIPLMEADAEVSNWKSVLFDSASHYSLGILSYILVAGIPVLMLVYTGIKLLFRLRYTNRWLVIAMGLAWVVGLFIAVFVTIVTLKDFSQYSRTRETVTLNPTSDTLYLRMRPVSETAGDLGLENRDEIESAVISRNNSYFFGESGNFLSVLGFAKLDVSEGESGRVDLIINRAARGRSKPEANGNARSINYNYRINNNVIWFDEIFSSGKGEKFRVQELEIRLRIPEGMVVYFDHSLRNFLNDADNTSNVWTGNMAGRRWKMTSRGLECIDCEGLDNAETHAHISANGCMRFRAGKRNIHINGNGIDIGGTMKISGNGIDIFDCDESKYDN